MVYEDSSDYENSSDSDSEYDPIEGCGYACFNNSYHCASFLSMCLLMVFVIIINYLFGMFLGSAETRNTRRLVTTESAEKIIGLVEKSKSTSQGMTHS